jgi:hypothetical protein
MEDYCAKTLEQLKTTVTDVATAFGDALAEIKGFWKWEFPDGNDERQKQKDREEFGHTRAESAIKLAQETAERINELFSAPGVMTQSQT